MKKYEITKEFKRAYELLEVLKMILPLYDKENHFQVTMNFLKYNCKGLKDVYKGFILHHVKVL